MYYISSDNMDHFNVAVNGCSFPIHANSQLLFFHTFAYKFYVFRDFEQSGAVAVARTSSSTPSLAATTTASQGGFKKLSVSERSV